MTEPFLGQLIFAAFDFPPKGYAHCNGSTLPINQNQALFSLLGTSYGGDGQHTFGLPDLRGRVPIHIGGGVIQGEKGGSSTVTLGQAQMPVHTHQVNARTQEGTQQTAEGAVLAATSSAMYGPYGNDMTQLSAATVGPAGSSQAHDNMQPYTVIGAYVAIQGIFPSKN